MVLLLGGGAARLFVYYCPESAPVKAKMTYSTAKATFADILAGPLGVDPEKTLEVRDAGDLQADVDAVVAPHADAAMPQAAGAGVPEGMAQMFAEMTRRIEGLESRCDELVDARDRLERQVAAQTEELRVQRAAIARTQHAVRNLGRGDESEEQ